MCFKGRSPTGAHSPRRSGPRHDEQYNRIAKGPRLARPSSSSTAHSHHTLCSVASGALCPPSVATRPVHHRHYERLRASKPRGENKAHSPGDAVANLHVAIAPRCSGRHCRHSTSASVLASRISVRSGEPHQAAVNYRSQIRTSRIWEFRFQPRRDLVVVVSAVSTGTH